jgi:DNA repair exonuclease SbcCD ATPase subunit/DNA repair exonuclease SbcCD nuclease subunit
MRNIDLGFNKIKTIYHIADVHIRNLKRHEEYKQVFNKLYSDIKQRGTKDAIIYLAGDIAHAKLELSPELVKEISAFLRECSELCPTFLIAGNHDCNLNNIHRLDALSPIVDGLNLPNLYYLRDTDVVKVHNITFGVFSIFDKKENWPKGTDIEGDVKIALFHGPIDKSQTDIGYVISSRNFTTDIFEGYDAALLGDIHKRQTVKQSNPIVVYPGSLIQQSHGEALEKHGYAIWDVETLTPSYVDIPNDYGYYTLHVDNGIVPIVTDMPKKPRLRVYVSNTDVGDMKRVTTEIKKKYNVDEFTITKTDSLSKLRNGVRDGKINVGDINDVDYQNGLIEDYLVRSFSIDNQSLANVKSLNTELNKRLTDEDLAKNIVWKPIKFEFSNMFSYGEDNVIDFTKLNGVIGLFAPNASGKSSIFDAVSFCAFDKCSRAFRASAILNNRKSNFKCKLHFQINDEDFFIERTAHQNSKGTNVKVDVQFWKEVDGQQILLNGTERRDTNKNISQYLGTYEDFVLTALSLQGNNALFIDKSQSERKDLLAQFMGINVFDKLYAHALEDIKEVQVLLKKFKSNDFTTELANDELKVVVLNDSYSVEEGKHTKLIEDRLEKNNTLLELTQQLVPVDASIADIDGLDKKKNEQEDKIQQLKDDEAKKLEQLEQFKDALIQISQSVNELATFGELDIEQAHTEYLRLSNLQTSSLHSIEKCKISLEKNEEKLVHLAEHEYDPNCNFCMNNVFVKDAQKTQEEVDSQKIVLEELEKNYSKTLYRLEKLNGVVDNYNDYKSFKQKFDKGKLSAEKLVVDIKSYESKKQAAELELQNIQTLIQRYHENEATIQNNKVLQKDINIIKGSIDDFDKDISSVQKEMLSLTGSISRLQEKISSVNEKIEEAKELEERYSTYEYYLDAVKRDGVSYDLIAKSLPVIEGEVNNILSQIVDFGVTLTMDGKNITANIVYEDQEWGLEMCSGMEKFISGLAIRVALINVCNLPRPNFLVLDEGFGTLDGENLQSTFLLFQYLKTQFDFVTIISHLDQIRDVVDTLVEIKKENGYSKISHK